MGHLADELAAARQLRIEEAEALRGHIIEARTLRARGLGVLAALPTDDYNVIDLQAGQGQELARLIANATAAIDRGVQIEQASRRRLAELGPQLPEAVR